MTLTISSYVSNHAAVPLVAMCVKLMFLAKNAILKEVIKLPFSSFLFIKGGCYIWYIGFSLKYFMVIRKS